jgi:hypothetical protein
VTARRGFIAVGLALVAAAVVGLGWMVLAGAGRHDAPAAGAAPPASTSVATSELPAPAVRAAAPSPLVAPVIDPVASPVTGAAGMGSLVVQVTFASDGRPAPDVVVRLTRWDDPTADTLVGRTDERGLWTVSPCAAGLVIASLDRGGRARSEVKAGAKTTLAVQVPVGVDVHGLVVDAYERPVVDAEIRLHENALVTSVVARTDEAGRFELPSLSRGSTIGARAPGYAPSFLVQIGDATGSLDVTLWLERGAAVQGVVVDSNGRPVNGADVRLGEFSENGPLHASDGTLREAPPPIDLETGDDGRFEADQLPEGLLPVSVRAAGFSPWHVYMVLGSSEPRQARIVLFACATVSGTVRDATGQPVAGATIDTPWHDGFGPHAATSAVDGAFTLRDVPAGDTFPLVASSGKLGRVRREFNLGPGESCTWDPVLAPLDVLNVRVVDAAGAPLAFHMVRAIPFGIPLLAEFGSTALTDEEGRATLIDCGDAPLLVTVFNLRAWGLPLITLHGVHTSPDVLLLTLPDRPPSARLHGRVVGENDAVPRLLGVAVESPAYFEVLGATVDGRTGRFASTELPPGDVTLIISTGRGVPHRVKVKGLAAGEDRDLGEVRLKDTAR